MMSSAYATHCSLSANTSPAEVGLYAILLPRSKITAVMMFPSTISNSAQHPTFFA